MNENILLIVLSIPVGLGLIAFFFVLRQMALDNGVRRYNQLHKYSPDHLGNYPAHYDFDQDFSRPVSGNSPVPVQHFIYPAQAPAVEKQKHERPIVMKPWSMRVMQPEQLEQPEQDFEPEQREQPETVQDFRDLLEGAKRRGVAKTVAISQITGVKRGGSKVYADWSKIWDELEV